MIKYSELVDLINFYHFGPNIKIMNNNSNTYNLGGYYAIKGFIFQFDKTILDILDNPNKDIKIEQIQDLGLENYYVQVKHKETQKYSHSKIQRAVIQLLSTFTQDVNQKFCLYCYFADKNPGKVKLNISDLDKILGNKKNCFTTEIKNSFTDNFIIEFSDNFYNQFIHLVNNIKKVFSLQSDEQAIIYHSLIRSKLLDIAINKDFQKRVINLTKLKKQIENNRKIVFELAYSQYLGYQKYLNYIKKEYFTLKKINIPPINRLFIIEVNSDDSNSTIITIINNIRSKYFIKYRSPSPYICLINIDTSRFNIIKQSLWDKNLFFSDGTNFNGDKFRIHDLIKDTSNNNSVVLFKLLFDKNIPLLLKKVKIESTSIFLISALYKISKLDNYQTFYLENINDIIKIIN